MTVLQSPKIVLGYFSGQSTDVKPLSTGGGLPINEGSEFRELDTGRIFTFNNGQWNDNGRDSESTNFFALEPRSSFVQLFGDTFATNPASSLYLLEDLTGVGADLVNNGGILNSISNDLPLRGFSIPTLNGVDQYYSTPTAVANQVGEGSFVASAWFKTDDTNATTKVIFAYGTPETNESQWIMNLNSLGAISCGIRDNTGIVVGASDSISNLYNDGKWHVATMVVDRNSNLLYLFADGELRASADISTITGSLDNVGESFYIGANKNTSGNVANFFNGQLANFQLYFPDTTGTLPPDYNLPALLHAGIRESATNDTGTWIQNVEVNSRLNNRFYPSNINGVYTTTVINVSEGFYDLQQLYFTGTNHGISTVQIDGIEHLRVDMYAGSSSFNQLAETKGIFLSGGSHIFKWKNDDNNALSSAFIMPTMFFNLIKRDGKDEGNDESSSGILFGDEIVQRTSPDFSFQVRTGAVYNNGFGQLSSATANDGEFNEGDIFLKKGLYKWTMTYFGNATEGLVDVWVGGVKVFDQIDFSTPTGDNLQVTRSAFIEGGKNTVKVQVNGTNGSDFPYVISSIRYELVTGKTNGDDVNIWGADDDLQAVQGTLPIVVVSGLFRFNFKRENSTTLLGDGIVYSRYFSGGTYKVQYHHQKNAGGGITDIGFGGVSNNILDGVDQHNGSQLYNEYAITTVTIPRGFQEITIANEADGDVDDFNYPFERLQFTKIATVENAELDDNSDPVHGALVPLGKIKATQSEATLTLDFGGVEGTKYGQIKILVKGRGTITNALQFTLNADPNGYFGDGQQYPVVPLNVNNASTFTVFPSSWFNTTKYQGEIIIDLNDSDIPPTFTCFFTKGNGGSVQMQGLQASAHDKLTQLVFTHPFLVNSYIDVYGVKK